MKRINRRNDRRPACQRLIAADGELVKLWGGQLRLDSAAAHSFLLSLMIDEARDAPESFSARQAEVARRRLAGSILNEVATKDITRCTLKIDLCELGGACPLAEWAMPVFSIGMSCLLQASVPA